MAAELWDTHLWQLFSAKQLLIVALMWSATFALILFRIVHVRRWDVQWTNRWERDHGQSITNLRRMKQRNLRVLTIVRWVMLAVLFMVLGASFGPILESMKGARKVPRLAIEAFVGLNLQLVLVVLVLVAGVELARYEIRRIDELILRRQ
jgi:prepilin signal peptidase PulO-like enzyme (type II secretory pathway)